jgi:hypothetical protein
MFFALKAAAPVALQPLRVSRHLLTIPYYTMVSFQIQKLINELEIF